jgi:hypothetical protein
MSSINPPGPIYSPTHPFDSSYKYEEPIDPNIPRGYPDQYGHLPQAVPQHPGPPPRRESQLSQGGQSRTGDGPKQRLRKACDSCSVRKVKVRFRLLWRVWPAEHAGYSATKVARRVNRARLSRFPVPSNDQADVEALPTDMLKLSSDRSWKMVRHNSRPPAPPHTMQLTVWLLFHCRPVSQPSRYATSNPLRS